MAFGGDGIAREDGKVIFIEGAVPGEKVEVEITQDKKRFAKGRAIRRIEAAADEVAPFCPVFARCGGCDWQHVGYQKQLEWKSRFISSALQKTARFPTEPISVRPSSSLSGFRNRIKLKASVYQGSMELGYFAKSSHDLVAIESCPIADPLINQKISELLALRFPAEKSWRGELEIQALENDKTVLNFVPKADFGLSVPGGDSSLLFETHEGIRYRTRPGQFQQVNVEGNHALRTWIKSKVEEIQPRNVIDLFCGSGNLSLALRKQNDDLKVFGLEYSETAIRTAQDNVKDNGFQGFEYKAGPANEIRSIFPELPESIDCVIVDPPRQGMDDSIEDLLALEPKHILSVSCDPNTFARDLKRLLECGYIPKEILGMDFFPHSYHIETLAHLVYDPIRDSRKTQG